MKKALKHWTAAALMSATAAAALAPTASQAVTPDPRHSISGYWSFPRTFHEWFDWRSYAGWGTVGAVNVAAIAMYGGSWGDLTTAAFSSLCGGSAAGVLATWKPVSDPSAASHIKAMVKAGGVAAAAAGCGWVAKTTFSKMDSEIPKAQNYINRNMTAAARQDLSTAVSTLNNAVEAASTSFHRMQDYNEQLKAVNRAYNDKGCGSKPGGDRHVECVKILSSMTDLSQQIAFNAKQILQFGNDVRQVAYAVDSAIKS